MENNEGIISQNTLINAFDIMGKKYKEYVM